jgi:hypothetical protein
MVQAYQLGGELLLLVVQPLFECADTLEEVGEAVDGGNGAQPGAVVGGWIAAHDGARCYVGGNTALRGRNGTVADGEVPSDADLAGEDDVFADGGGAAEAGLGAKQGVLADRGAVAYLDEIVDFDAVGDAGLANGGAVDAGVGLDLDGVL